MLSAEEESMNQPRVVREAKARLPCHVRRRSSIYIRAGSTIRRHHQMFSADSVIVAVHFLTVSGPHNPDMGSRHSSWAGSTHIASPEAHEGETPNI